MALSRRQFLGVVGVVAAASAYPAYRLIDDAVEEDFESGGPGDPADFPTTLLATIAFTGSGRYRALTTAKGEDFDVRDDLGTFAAPDRAADRRSVLFFAQFTDTHVIDAQTPARVEWTFSPEAGVPPGATRAQDTLTIAVLEQMVEAVNAVPESPVTGAPMALALVTGDNTDSKAGTELRWYIDVLDGKPVTPNSGSPDYQGVQAWEESTYAYHPDDPSKDAWGMRGYPARPGLLAAAVSTEVRSPGLSVPWLAVSGNHDIEWQGNFYPFPVVDQLAAGDLKLSNANGFGTSLVGAEATGNRAGAEAAGRALAALAPSDTTRRVAADERRKLFSIEDFVEAHFDSPSNPGPVGHGFTDRNRRDGTAFWARDEGPLVRFVGLDTNNHYLGADGSLPEDQYRFLEQQLRQHSSRYYDESGNEQQQQVDDKLVIVTSHHTSWTMENTAQDPDGPQLRLYVGPEVVELLLRYPNCIAWVNGHTHTNTIRAHPSTIDSGAGFWEINTASCIDYGQQQRLIDVVDNRDGTLSIFTITLDSAASPATSGSGYSVARMASISRELAANQFFDDPTAKLGKAEDRNTELMVKAPFDVGRVDDDELALEALGARTRLLVPRLAAARAGA